MGFWSSYSPSTTPPLHSTQTHSLLCLHDNTLRSAPLRRPPIEIQAIAPGNQALAATISRAITPAFKNLPAPSPQPNHHVLSPSWQISSRRQGPASN